MPFWITGLGYLVLFVYDMAFFVAFFRCGLSSFLGAVTGNLCSFLKVWDGQRNGNIQHLTKSFLLLERIFVICRAVDWSCS